ncbi:MAG: c-type cytochrome [Saprospiraceae bacterium]|nr:c-type cytochrome [Saprospiraceae bacterium]
MTKIDNHNRKPSILIPLAALCSISLFFISSCIDQTTSQHLTEGELLFEHYCTDCHSVNLKQPETGPPLGNISLFRTEEYLLNVTKNYSKEIQKVNELATCVKKYHPGVIMNSFEFLTETEIQSIYTFIDEESSRQKLRKNDVKYISSCKVTDQNGTQFFDQFGNEIVNYAYDTISIDKQHNKSRFQHYFFNTLSWDILFDTPQESIDLGDFKIETQSPPGKLIRAFIIYEELQLVNQLNYFKGAYYFNYPTSKFQKINLFGNQNFKLLLLEESTDEVLLYGMKELSRNELNQSHSISLNVVSKEKVKQFIDP